MKNTPNLKIIETLNISLVEAQRRGAYIQAKARGAMARVKARWNKAQGEASPRLTII